MYWFRTTEFIPLLPWLVTSLCWCSGGWLIAAHAFNLERRARLVAGFGLGLLLSAFLTNLLGHRLLGDAPYYLAALLTLTAGLVFKGKEHSPWRDWRLAESWQPVLLAVLLSAAAMKIFQGVAIFDEFVHVPLISTLAVDRFPPTYFANSRVLFAYHYGFHIIGAGLVRLGGLLPWSAADLGKALVWGPAVSLAWLLGKRVTAHPWGAALAAGALVFAGGTRFLLLLAPEAVLLRLNHAIAFQGDEAAMGLSFAQMLSQYWRIEGQPPIPFLFGFQSGIAEPYLMQLTGSSTLSVFIFLLSCLLAGRQRGWRAYPVLTALYAFWALTAETGYAMFAAGGLGAAAIAILAARKRPSESAPDRSNGVWIQVAALLSSAGVALLQGGVLTEIARGIFLAGDAGAAGFSLRWPPAIISKHLGALSLFSPLQILIGIFELGPLLWLAPWTTAWAWRRFRSGDWLFGTLAISAVLSLFVPVVVDYHSGPDLSRITAYGMTIWAILLAWMLLDEEHPLVRWLRNAAAAGLGLACFSGLMLAASLLTAGPGTVLAAGLSDLDARIGQDYWDKLPRDAEVFDSIRGRAPALTARFSHALTGNQAVGYGIDPGWAAMEAAPKVADLLANGYRFVYADERWWRSIPADSRRSLSQDCVRLVVELSTEDRFRRLLDLEGCSSP